jgi:NAD(P)H-dependent FMN reductase
MSNNILILSGSPHKGGNTDQLVGAFSKGAEGSGKTVTLFRVAAMKIGGCLGCNYCFSHDGECIQKDDMPQILAALRTADTVVFASPIYHASVSAQLKAALDRTYAHKTAMPPELVTKLTGRMPDPWKKGVLLLTCASPDTEVAAASIAMYKAILSHSGREDGGIIVAGGVRDHGAIAGNPVLEQAENLGREI